MPRTEGAAPSATRSIAVPGGVWPLTGRTEELALIADATAYSNGGVGVVIAGAAGVGKTRLAREALDAARRRGRSGRWFVATNSARSV